MVDCTEQDCFYPYRDLERYPRYPCAEKKKPNLRDMPQAILQPAIQHRLSRFVPSSQAYFSVAWIFACVYVIPLRYISRSSAAVLMIKLVFIIYRYFQTSAAVL